jgi:single-stranded DNA-binding protein
MSIHNISNNQVTVIGKIIKPFTLSHTTFEERFYMTELSVPRRSGTIDNIPLVVPEVFIDINTDYQGRTVTATGQYRSYNIHDENRRLLLWVFAKTIEFDDPLCEDNKCDDNNQIYLNGYLCKAPIFRQTPLGREITELLLAVNRSYGKSDYIPCICWHIDALHASECLVGDQCTIWGRIQSREYQKHMPDGQIHLRTAYEVSVSRIAFPDQQQLELDETQDHPCRIT